jgi:NPL4 family
MYVWSLPLPSSHPFRLTPVCIKVTHGFPQNPSPLFRSNHFTIENRSGIEEQTIEQVMRSLNELGAPDVQVSRRRGDDARRRVELAKWLSDWHLVAFLGTCGLLSQVRSVSGDPITLPHTYLEGRTFTTNVFSRMTRKC